MAWNAIFTLYLNAATHASLYFCVQCLCTTLSPRLFFMLYWCTIQHPYFFIGTLIRMYTIVTTCLMIVVTCCTIVLCATWAVTCTIILLRSIGLYHIEGQCPLHVVSMSQVVKSDIIEYHAHLMIGYNEISSVLLRVLWKAATLVTMIDFFCVCWIIVIHVRNTTKPSCVLAMVHVHVGVCYITIAELCMAIQIVYLATVRGFGPFLPTHIVWIC